MDRCWSFKDIVLNGSEQNLNLSEGDRSGSKKLKLAFPNQLDVLNSFPGQVNLNDRSDQIVR